MVMLLGMLECSFFLRVEIVFVSLVLLLIGMKVCMVCLFLEGSVGEMLFVIFLMLGVLVIVLEIVFSLVVLSLLLEVNMVIVGIVLLLLNLFSSVCIFVVFVDLGRYVV